MRWNSPFLILAMLIFLCLSGYTFYCVLSSAEPSNYLFVFGAGVLASLGWMYTNEQNIINARNQYTVNLLFQSRFSEFQHKMIRQFDTKMAVLEGADIPAQLYVDFHKAPQKMEPGDLELLIAARYMLSYYEYISLMIRKDVLDEELCYNTMGTSSRHVLSKCNRMVAYIRGEIDAEGNPTGTLNYPKAYENLIWWVERMKRLDQKSQRGTNS